MLLNWPTDLRPSWRALGTVALLLSASLRPFTSVAAQSGARGTVQPPPAGRGVPMKPDLSKLPKTPKVPTTFEGLFAERDARATNALEYLSCMQATINALRSGQLGKVPTDWSITCIKQGKEWRGVFGSLTDDGIAVRLQYALRADRGVITRDAIDTARVSGTARALLRGLSAPRPGGGKYPIIPIALPQNKFVEVWFVAANDNAARAVVGGDSLIQMNAEGTRELGHIKATSPIRTLEVTPSATSWTLESLEERIPSVSEMMAAHAALTVVPEVRVRTHQYDSIIRRGASGWTHVHR